METAVDGNVEQCDDNNAGTDGTQCTIVATDSEKCTVVVKSGDVSVMKSLDLS